MSGYHLSERLLARLSRPAAIYKASDERLGWLLANMIKAVRYRADHLARAYDRCRFSIYVTPLTLVMTRNDPLHCEDRRPDLAHSTGGAKSLSVCRRPADGGPNTRNSWA
jgi:hypothetical protein